MSLITSNNHTFASPMDKKHIDDIGTVLNSNVRLAISHAVVVHSFIDMCCMVRTPGSYLHMGSRQSTNNRGKHFAVFINIFETKYDNKRRKRVAIETISCAEDTS